MSWLMPDVDGEQRILEDRRSAAEFGQKFVWCVEHERPVSTCRQLALGDYGQLAFDNCQWITEVEMDHDSR
jgi:hypothetical protein